MNIEKKHKSLLLAVSAGVLTGAIGLGSDLQPLQLQENGILRDYDFTTQSKIVRNKALLNKVNQETFTLEEENKLLEPEVKALYKEALKKRALIEEKIKECEKLQRKVESYENANS